MITRQAAKKAGETTAAVTAEGSGRPEADTGANRQDGQKTNPPHKAAGKRGRPATKNKTAAKKTQGNTLEKCWKNKEEEKKEQEGNPDNTEGAQEKGTTDRESDEGKVSEEEAEKTKGHEKHEEKVEMTTEKESGTQVGDNPEIIINELGVYRGSQTVWRTPNNPIKKTASRTNTDELWATPITETPKTQTGERKRAGHSLDKVRRTLWANVSPVDQTTWDGTRSPNQRTHADEPSLWQGLKESGEKRHEITMTAIDSMLKILECEERDESEGAENAPGKEAEAAEGSNGSTPTTPAKGENTTHKKVEKDIKDLDKANETKRNRRSREPARRDEEETESSDYTESPEPPKAWQQELRDYEENWERRMAAIERLIKENAAGKKGHDSGEDCHRCEEHVRRRREADRECTRWAIEHEKLKREALGLLNELEKKQKTIDSLVQAVEEERERTTAWRTRALAGDEETAKLPQEKTETSQGGHAKPPERHSPAEGTTLAHAAKAAGGSGVPEATSDERSDTRQQPGSRPPPTPLTDEEWMKECELRKKRARNIRLRGLTLVSAEKRKELESWARNEAGIRIRVVAMSRMGNGGWLVTLETKEQKLKLLGSLEQLQEVGWGVEISDDLTERQTAVQEWLEDQAEGWRAKGKEALVKYQKIEIDGHSLSWMEREGELRTREDPRTRSTEPSSPEPRGPQAQSQQCGEQAQRQREQAPAPPPPTPSPTLPPTGRGRGRGRGWSKQ